MDAARSAEVPPETEPSGLMGSSSMRFEANRPTDVAKSNAETPERDIEKRRFRLRSDGVGPKPKRFDSFPNRGKPRHADFRRERPSARLDRVDCAAHWANWVGFHKESRSHGLLPTCGPFGGRTRVPSN